LCVGGSYGSFDLPNENIQLIVPLMTTYSANIETFLEDKEYMLIGNTNSPIT
jgi:hypothetical protein